MLNQILNLKGVQPLNIVEQKAISGGKTVRVCCEWCSDGSCSDWTTGGTPCPFTLPC